MDYFRETKNPTLNGGCMSKARVNLASKVTFSEILFNFLQNRALFCTLYPRGYKAGDFAIPGAAPSGSPDSKINDEPVKDLNLLLFVNFIW